jgi:phosphoglycolate phosphatase-like HAD superfamily hydrolase
VPRLAIFDIDGTLTSTNDVDVECFLLAVADMLAVEVSALDWTGAPHVTDASIASWLSTTHRGADLSDCELRELVCRFVDRLSDSATRSPSRFAPVTGAVGLLGAVRAAGWDTALATGGWEASARLKLELAGLAESEIVLVSASDAPSREEIVLLAVDRAAALRGVSYERVVSVGDGTWDLRTAEALGLPFVGVGSGRHAKALRTLGAATVIEDFTDRAAVLRALETTTVPQAPTVLPTLRR